MSLPQRNQHASAKCCQVVQNAYTVVFGKMTCKPNALEYLGFIKSSEYLKGMGFGGGRLNGNKRPLGFTDLWGGNYGWKGVGLPNTSLFLFSRIGHQTLAIALRQTPGIPSTISVMGWLAPKSKLTA